MTACCSKSHKVSDHQRGKGVRSSVIIECGLSKQFWRIQEEDNANAKESTGLVKPHHTNSVSETQITSQDSWFSIKAFLYILSRGQDVGFWKRLHSELGLDGDCQIWGRDGLYSIALFTTFAVMCALYFFCHATLILFSSSDTWPSADNRLFWKAGQFALVKLSSGNDKAGSWNNKSLRDLKKTATVLCSTGRIYIDDNNSFFVNKQTKTNP